jgi:hypothetical protein
MRYSPPDIKLQERTLIDIPPESFTLQIFEDPMFSHFSNAMSMVIDLLEQYAIHAIAKALPKLAVAGAEFQEQARLFVLQERQHSSAHRAHQAFLKTQEYEHAADDIREHVRSFRSILNNDDTFEELLFSSVCFEHLTTTISHYFARIFNDALNTANPAGLYLLSYHATEELEHKGICFDTYQYLYGTSPLATEASCKHFAAILNKGRKIMTVALQSIFNTENKLHPHQTPFDKRAAHTYLKNHPIFTDNGFYESYQNPSFHPWDIDDRAFIKAWDTQWRFTLESKIQQSSL